MIKIYKPLVEGMYNGMSKDDLFIYDTDTNSYVLSKSDNDYAENKESHTTVYVSLPASFVETNEHLFELVTMPEVKQPEIVEDFKSTTDIKIVERKDNIAAVLKALVDLYGPDFEGASDELLSGIADLQIEYTTLDWVINNK